MMEEQGIVKIPGSCPRPSRSRGNPSPNRQIAFHDWDFESNLQTEPKNRQGCRIRASSWDDSDDNQPPVPDTSGSKTCRIYTSEDKKPRHSVYSEIDELKKQFFKNKDKYPEMEGSSLKENQKELNSNRRQSPARVRRRSKSSGSSSPVREVENRQASPTKMNTSSGSDADFQEMSPKILQYDPGFFLNNFFAELQSKKINITEAFPFIEGKSNEMPSYDQKLFSELCNPEEKDVDGFCKTARKLSQILEVEENRRDLEKNPEENPYSCKLFDKCFKKSEAATPQSPSLSKQSERIPKSLEEERKELEKYRSLSSEHLKVLQNLQQSSGGSLSERSHKFFDRKLDDDFISLSAKKGETQLASPKCVDDKSSNTVQVFSANTTDRSGKIFSGNPEDEKNSETLESLKLDTGKNSESSTPRKSTDRSDRSRRSRSGRSRRSYNVDSPKFSINIGKDSERSLKMEDLNDSQRKDNSEKSTCRKSTPEKCSGSRTDRIPPIPIESPSMESMISTRRSFRETDTTTGRSKDYDMMTGRSRENELVTGHSKNNEVMSGRLKENELVPGHLEDNEVMTRRLKDDETVTGRSRDREVMTRRSRNNEIVTGRSKENDVMARRLKDNETMTGRSKDSEMMTGRSKENEPMTSRSKENELMTERSKGKEMMSGRSNKSDRMTGYPRENEILLTGRSKESIGSHRSHRKKRKQRNNANLESDRKDPETTESHSTFESYRSGERSHRTARNSARTTNKEAEQEIRSPHSRSSRISRSPKQDIAEDTSAAGSPRSSKIIPELDFRLDIPEKPESLNASHRSTKTADTPIKDSDRSELRRRRHRQSERSLSSRSKTAISRYSSPPELNMTARTNISQRSLDSLENRDDNINAENGIPTWKDIEKAYETMSNHSLVSSPGRNSFREAETQNQHSYRSDISNSEPYHTPAIENTLKDRALKSRNSSRTSIDSETDHSLPARSALRSRPHSSKEGPSGISSDGIPEPISGRTSRSFLSEEDEDIEESQPTHRSKFEDESDRLSNKRLSVINEVSIEDLEASQSSTENEDKEISRPRTRQNRMSQKKTVTETNTPEDEKWNDLIKKFDDVSNSKILEITFPGYPLQKDNSWNLNESFDENPEEKNAWFEKSVGPNLGHQHRLSDGTKQEEFIRPMQHAQNIYYMNVDAGTSFIGEFGDVTCWNSGDIYTKDSDKPKGHGDGIPTQRTPDIVTEKNEKDADNPLRGYFPDSTSFSSKKMPEETELNHYVPCRLKISKSDNCINISIGGDKEDQIQAEKSLSSYKYQSEAGDVELEENKKTVPDKYGSKSTLNQNSSAESLESEKDWENFEFELERTPRLSRSLSNLDSKNPETIYKKEPSETLSNSGSELFRKTEDVSKAEKEYSNWSVILPPTAKEDKTKPSMWLKLKASPKLRKTVRTKLRKKPTASPKGSFYISSKKNHPSVPVLKLRHPNCFQNFYKRFISVFCLTSNSSAATSN